MVSFYTYLLLDNLWRDVNKREDAKRLFADNE